MGAHVKYTEIGTFEVGLNPVAVISVCSANDPAERKGGFIILFNGEVLLFDVLSTDVSFIPCSDPGQGDKAVTFHGYAFPIDGSAEPEIKRLFNIANLSLV